MKKVNLTKTDCLFGKTYKKLLKIQSKEINNLPLTEKETKLLEQQKISGVAGSVKKIVKKKLKI